MQMRPILSFLFCILICGAFLPVYPQGFGTIFGRVTDAVTGEAVSNATVKISGATLTTNRFGQYLLRNVPPTFRANFTTSDLRFSIFPISLSLYDASVDGISGLVECTSPGYVPYRNSIIKILPCKRTEITFALTKDLIPGSLRLILTWKDRPKDLDTYFYIPSINGLRSTNIDYLSRGSIDAPPFAYLDRDARNGFGPETLTIRRLFPGTYSYSVFNNSAGAPNPVNGLGELAGSGAVVEIFNDRGLLNSIIVPEQKSTTGNAQWWNVCTIDGNTGNITVINKVTNQSTYSTITVAQLQDNAPTISLSKPGAALQSVTNAVYQWNFGSGRGDYTRQNTSVVFDSLGIYDLGFSIFKPADKAGSTITKPMFVSNIMLVGSQDFHIYGNEFN